jgi:hypothetical protein
VSSDVRHLPPFHEKPELPAMLLCALFGSWLMW